MKNIINLKIKGLHCAGCAATVEKALSKVGGVSSAAVSLDKEKAIVEGSANSDLLIGAVEKSGYGASLIRLA